MDALTLRGLDVWANESNESRSCQVELAALSTNCGGYAPARSQHHEDARSLKGIHLHSSTCAANTFTPSRIMYRYY